jgi:hypothetical protein
MKTTQRLAKGKASHPRTSALPEPAESDLDQVVGSLRSEGKAKTLAQMESAIKREVNRRHRRGRY